MCCADLRGVPSWLLPSREERAEAVASNSKVRLGANAEMAASAARNKPVETKRKRATFVGQYQDPDGRHCLPFQPPFQFPLGLCKCNPPHELQHCAVKIGGVPLYVRHLFLLAPIAPFYRPLQFPCQRR